MLDTTLATHFVPGTNVRGEVAGANWTFLLPHTGLERIICLGVPSQAALMTLTELAPEVVIATMPGSQGTTLWPGLDKHAHVVVHEVEQPLKMLADASVDLIYITDSSLLQWWRLGHPKQLSELRRVIKPEGLLYGELVGIMGGLLSSWIQRRFEQALGSSQLFWLTPDQGEMQTAVPIQDRYVITYFLKSRLYSSILDLPAMKRTLRTFRGRASRQLHRVRRFAKSAPQVQKPVAASLPAVSSVDPDNGRRPAMHKAGLLLMSRALAGADALGHFMSLHSVHWNKQRRALLAGDGAVQLGHRPPQYLRQIALDAGVDIEQHRWGLSARGEYRSRKVLYTLLERSTGTPEYIVKMTRAPSLNYRLENEYRALSLLEQYQLSRVIRPRAVFFGYHRGLALVGETIISGAPFESRSRATPSCRLADAAIESFCELGAVSATRTADPGHVADHLDLLFERFKEIYCLSPRHEAFLAAQIESIRGYRGSVPLVFQHGDPGTWNIVVTETGAIGLLDWEAAEPQGLPLWDLLYFLRSYGVWSARISGMRDPLQAVEYRFLRKSPFNGLVVEAIQRYCSRLAIDGGLVKPLFYTCWMHRALKEATRLPASVVEQGHYVSLLRLCINGEQSSVLRNITAGYAE